MEDKPEFIDISTDDETLAEKEEALTTKKFVELIIEDKLRESICKFCLNVTEFLYEFEQLFKIPGEKSIVSITLRDMIGTIYPFQISDNPNIPDKICETCLNRTISGFLFAQQCDRAVRAVKNCIDDVYEKLEKLDPLEPTKKRGRQKLHPNTNVIHSLHKLVINYADPLMSLINKGCIEDTHLSINPLECPHCWQGFSSIELLLNHLTVHPKSAWFYCKICGKSFSKAMHYRRHIRQDHNNNSDNAERDPKLDCKCDCGYTTQNYSEYLQHAEKHRFKSVMENIVTGKLDKTCTICLNRGANMTDLDSNVCLHGGYPEITGDKNVYSILSTALPNISNDLTSTKVCEKCFDRVITTYLLIQESNGVKDRLKHFLDDMIRNLDNMAEPKNTIFIEISPDFIMPKFKEDIFDKLSNDMEIDVLEDEFRIEESESDSEREIVSKLEENDENVKLQQTNDDSMQFNDIFDDKFSFFNRFDPKLMRTYSRKVVNGYRINETSDQVVDNSKLSNDNCCFEFLTFNKKPVAKKICVEKNYKCCLVCNKKFISEYFLRRHLRKHIMLQIRCKRCDLILNSKFCLIEHYKSAHLDNNLKFTCTQCSRCFTNYSKLEKHQNTHSFKNCHLCDKAFINYKHFESHLRRHVSKVNSVNKGTTNTCSFCEKICSNKNFLSLHVNKFHLQIKPYPCDMCDEKFYMEHNLKEHKKMHRVPVDECCSLCGKTLKNRRHFVVHLRRHLGSKPYACQICHRTFYCEGKMFSHMKMCHGGKYYCFTCRKGFLYKIDMRNHIKSVH